jgi:hypothetical protein
MYIRGNLNFNSGAVMENSEIEKIIGCNLAKGNAAGRCLVFLKHERDDLRSIFKRVVDIIGFHNGDDAEKVEAIRQVMLTAKHLEKPCT